LNDDQKLSLISNKKDFLFYKYKTGYKVKVINFDNHKSVYSISSQILANSRLKMIQTIERFLKHPSVEICYCNIDSIHISILEKEVDNFINMNRDIISNKLGDLKIEAIAKTGYWFDIGRYWLKNKDEVVLFKNSYFNQRGNSQPYLKNRKVNTVCLRDNFNFVKTNYINIYNKFSYTKRIVPGQNNISLDYINLNRYNFSEISNLDVVVNTLKKEKLINKALKKSLFNKIATTVKEP
jgi:hypothetical protein